MTPKELRELLTKSQNGDPDDDCLNFNFIVSYTPSVGLDNDDVNLQQVAGAILEDILEKSIESGTLDTKERE